MNKHIVFSLLIYTATALHSMEPGKANQQALALPDLQPLYQALKSDYENYLKNRLEEYKKTDVNMDELVAMSTIMTGQKHPDNSSASVFQTRDEYANSFIHIAVQKADLLTVEWIYHNVTSGYALNENKCGCRSIDLCIQQLSPAVIGQQKDTDAHKILDATILHTGGARYSASLKTDCLRKIVALQLEHQKNNTELSFTPELLRCLIPKKELAQEASYISQLYQQAADGDGNTFTHILVEQELSDDLFELIQQGRVSFAKNKADQTPADLALAMFRHFTQDVTRIDGHKDIFEKRKCCLFMLLNYLKIKSGDSTGFDQCCDKHKIAQ